MFARVPLLLFSLLPLVQSTNIILPLYIFPNATSWIPLTTALTNFPSLGITTIVNPASGPGGPAPDTSYAPAVTNLKTFPNAVVVGYVATGNGGRSVADIEADIDDWAAWPAATRPVGIFFDQVASGDVAGATEIMATVAAYATSKGLGTSITFNCGVIPTDATLYTLADQVVVFESPFSAYSALATMIEDIQEPGESISIIVHTMPLDEPTLENLATTFLGRGYGSVYLTDNPATYSSFGLDWTNFTTLMAA